MKSKPLMEVNMYRPNDQAKKPDLGSRYGEIGISAVAAALNHRSGVKIGAIGHVEQRTKSQTAWETAARCAALAQEADNSEEREYYARLHDAWTTLAKRCEDFNVPDVTEK
jgi:DNA integrity scanning protein DisA with diadenylate cyclase activity